MVVEGTEKLSDILRALTPLSQDNLLFSSLQKIKPFLLENASRIYIDYVVQKSILLYVRQGTIMSSNAYMPLETYSGDILAVDDFLTLMFLTWLPEDMKQEVEIHWIIAEKKVSISKSTMLSVLGIIDLLLERNGKNSVGRLNYYNIEKLFIEVVGKQTIDKLFRHKNSTNLFETIFGIFPSSKKNPYAYKKDILELNLENKNYYNARVFRPICPVCKKKKSIILNDSTIINDKYGKPNDIVRYIRKNKKVYAKFICKSCRNIATDQLVFVREVAKVPKTNVEKDTSFLLMFKQYLEGEEGGFSALLTDQIITSMGGNNDAK